MKAVVESPSVEHRVGRLKGMLELAQEMYFSEDPNRDRIAARTALAACINFVLVTVPDSIDLLLPLRELNYALHELDQGHVRAILKREVKRGRKETAISVVAFRATAAVLMELYSRNAVGRGQAAAAAAERLAELGYRDERNRPITAAQVEDWRDKVKEGGDSIGVKRFRKSLEVLHNIVPNDPERAIQFVLDSLSAIRRPVGLPVENPQESK